MPTGRNITFRIDCILYNSNCMPTSIFYDGNISYVARKLNNNLNYMYATGSYECAFGVFVDRTGYI